jgi:predicted nicotinamide N-methyase
MDETSHVEGGDDDDIDKNDCTIHLFEQEERDFIEIRLSPAATSALRLRQFGSHDDRWGIHSTVWDGGVALLQYVATHYEPVRRRIPNSVEEEGTDHCGRGTDAVYVLDLGSGTGITGLGIAALTNGQCRVALTDLPEALPLLQENLHLNAKFWEENQNLSPIVREVTWGCPTSQTSWLSEFLGATDKSLDLTEKISSSNAADERGTRRVLVTGADIVYRPSLFDPLLMTLTDLYEQLHETAIVDIWLSCQSIRTHLNEFWEAAAQHGFSTRMMAVAIKNGDEIQDLSQIVLEVDPQGSDPPFTTFPKGLGISWIVSLVKN